MERLTTRHSGVAVIKDKSKIKEAMEKLAQYEETGLTPKEVIAVNTFVGSQIEELLKMLAEEKAKHKWIPADKPPKTDDYILLSFANYSGLMIGRYEEDEDGGAYHLGDENVSALACNLYVNAWMKLPESYMEGADDR